MKCTNRELMSLNSLNILYVVIYQIKNRDPEHGKARRSKYSVISPRLAIFIQCYLNTR